MNQPKVSVIIPVYNTEQYLRQCLDSVVNQTLKDIEIICVDDGSTDGSLSILREYEAKDSRVKVLTQQNQFAGAARNRGLRHASGQYCIFLDSDDFFDHELLRKAHQKALEDNADIVAFHFYRYHEDGTTEKRVGVHREWLNEKKTVFSYHDCPDYIMSVVNPTPWTKLYRTAYIIDHNFRYEEIATTNDITFAAVSVAFAERVSILNEHLVYYRVGHSGTISSAKSKNPDNMITAIKSGVAQACAHPSFAAIKNSVMRFAVENIVFTCKHVIADFNDPVVQKFFIDAKAVFNTPLFDHCSAGTLHSQTLFTYFRCIREDGYLSFAKMISGGTAPGNIVVDNIIVSLTSYPPRIGTVHKTIETLLNQTVHPGKLILWLAEEEFPNREADLPKELLAQTARGLTIGWCNNIGPYKKLIPALRQYPDAIIVTADDDLYYNEEWLDRLYADYLQNPDCIPCQRVTKISIGEDGSFTAIPGGKEYWPFPCYLNKLGGGSGTLFPPHCFYPDVLDEAKFMALAPTSDDLWFWLMAALAGYRVHVVHDPFNSLHYVEGTQDCALWHINDHGENLFWVHFHNILEAYPQLSYRLRAAWREVSEMGSASLGQAASLRHKLVQREQELRDIKGSASFRIGRVITWLPRKLRGLAQCLRDNGLGYTIRRCLYHLGLWEDEENPGHREQPLLRRFADCYAQHGLRYTAWRVLVFLHLSKDDGNAAVPSAAAAKVVKDYAYYSTLPPEKYPEELKLWYKRVMKEELDLDNPKTCNEKLQWLKLYDATPLKTRLADKYLVRDWVKEKIGEEYLIPLLGVWDSFDEIDFDKLPNQFALKANHGSGWNIIVKDKAAFDKAEAKKKFDAWMHTNFAFKWGLELHYMNIPPKIIAEQYMENLDQLIDYKVWCSDGKARFIWVDTDRFTAHKRTLFTLDWEKLPITMGDNYPMDTRDIPKPVNLEKMIRFAELLCQDFCQVRVDFYEVDGKLYFGEMTFTSSSGTEHTTPRSFERELGDLITLPPKSPIPTPAQNNG